MKLNLNLSFLLILVGCQPGLEPGIKPMPSSMPMPTETPSSLPSSEPSSNAGTSITPIPTASPFPAELLGKSHYTPKFPCKEIQNNDISNPVLTAPRDIAVTQDGKEIYITLNTPFVKGFRNGGVFHTENKSKVLPLERTHLYRMKFYKPDDSTTSVVNIEQDYHFSCGFNGEIEMTSDNQLLISYPEIDTRPDLRIREPLVKSHHFYYLDIGTYKTKKILSYKLTPVPDNYNHWGYMGNADARRLTNLHLDLVDQNIFYYLSTGGEILNDRIERWNRSSNTFETLIEFLKKGVTQPAQAISSKSHDNVIVNNRLFQAPFPYMNKPYSIINTFEDFVFNTENINCSKLPVNSSQFIFRTGNPKSDKKGNFFFSGQPYRSQASFIWKQTPDNQITCIAGNGKNGYLDGKGLEASFNQPSELDIDAAGNIYVADTGNNAIRKITPNGEVTTLYRAPGTVISK